MSLNSPTGFEIAGAVSNVGPRQVQGSSQRARCQNRKNDNSYQTAETSGCSEERSSTAWLRWVHAQAAKAVSESSSSSSSSSVDTGEKPESNRASQSPAATGRGGTEPEGGEAPGQCDAQESLWRDISTSLSDIDTVLLRWEHIGTSKVAGPDGGPPATCQSCWGRTAQGEEQRGRSTCTGPSRGEPMPWHAEGSRALSSTPAEYSPGRASPPPPETGIPPRRLLKPRREGGASGSPCRAPVCGPESGAREATAGPRPPHTPAPIPRGDGSPAPRPGGAAPAPSRGMAAPSRAPAHAEGHTERSGHTPSPGGRSGPAPSTGGAHPPPRDAFAKRRPPSRGSSPAGGHSAEPGAPDRLPRRGYEAGRLRASVALRSQLSSPLARGLLERYGAAAVVERLDGRLSDAEGPRPRSGPLPAPTPRPTPSAGGRSGMAPLTAEDIRRLYPQLFRGGPEADSASAGRALQQVPESSPSLGGGRGSNGSLSGSGSAHTASPTAEHSRVLDEALNVVSRLLEGFSPLPAAGGSDPEAQYFSHFPRRPSPPDSLTGSDSEYFGHGIRKS